VLGSTPSTSRESPGENPRKTPHWLLSPAENKNHEHRLNTRGQSVSLEFNTMPVILADQHIGRNGQNSM